MMNNKGLAVKPARLYDRKDLSLDDIKEGDIISAIATDYIWEEGKIKCMISSKVPNAFIREVDFDFLEFPFWFDESNVPVAIKANINKPIVAKVTKKFDDGTIELDRKTVMEDTVKYLYNNVGRIVTATVEDILTYGAFVDLGNGVKSLLHISKFSQYKYSNLKDLFSIGDQVEVKLIRFNEDTSRFELSRKCVYKRKFLTPHSIQRVRVLDRLPGGAFVEFDPATIGIMNIPKDLSSSVRYGQYVMCFVKTNKEKGFRANFLSPAD